MDSGEPQSVVSDYDRLTSSFVLLLADVVSSSSSSSSFNNNNQFTSNKYVNICFIYIYLQWRQISSMCPQHISAIPTVRAQVDRLAIYVCHFYDFVIVLLFGIIVYWMQFFQWFLGVNSGPPFLLKWMRVHMRAEWNQSNRNK